MKHKTLLQLVLVVGIFLGTTLPAYSQETTEEKEEAGLVVERETWAADDNVLSFEEAYAFPGKVVVVPIKNPNLSSDSETYLKDLYYYFSTRSGFGDFPFHYIVGVDGTVYRGNKLGDEAKINFGNETDAILVAYLQEDDSGLELSSVDALKELLLEVINSYAISPDNIEIKNLNFQVGN